MFGMKPFRYLPKCIRVLLIANAVVFLIGLVLPGLRSVISAYGAISPFDTFCDASGCYYNLTSSALHQVWRYFTYAFIHGGFWHFLFNMMMLWMFGDEICDWLGERKFVGLYMFSAIFAGLFSIPFYLIGAINGPIIGASGALMGLFFAYYKLFPERRLLMFFVIPMKMKYAIWIMAFFDIMMSPSSDGIAHFTHLGGFIAGFIFMALFTGRGIFANGISNARVRVRKPRFKVYTNENVEDAEVLEGEVFDMDDNRRLDEILKKVKEQGVQSLTSSEREFLLKKSKEMNGEN